MLAPLFLLGDEGHSRARISDGEAGSVVGHEHISRAGKPSHDSIRANDGIGLSAYRLKPFPRDDIKLARKSRLAVDIERGVFVPVQH